MKLCENDKTLAYPDLVFRLKFKVKLNILKLFLVISFPILTFHSERKNALSSFLLLSTLFQYFLQYYFLVSFVPPTCSISTVSFVNVSLF